MKLIKKAIKALKPIVYIPQEVGYVVTMNGEYLGSDIYCIDCINGAVKEAKGFIKKQRKDIEKKYYNYILNHPRCDLKTLYIQKQEELKQYPIKPTFDYVKYIPVSKNEEDTEPMCCESCNDYFESDFVANDIEALYLLEVIEESDKIPEYIKWESNLALLAYEKSDSRVQDILLTVAELIIKKDNLYIKPPTE